MAFATFTDVENRLRQPPDASEAARIEVLLDDATDAIRAAAGGQVIYPAATETIVIPGAGRKILRLPQVPVTAVSAVTVTNTAGVVTTLAASAYGWDTDGRLEALWGGSIRGCWNGAVTVTYTHSFATVDDIADLVGLCARLVVAEVDPRAGKKSESVAGTYSVAYTDGTGAPSTLAMLSDSDRRIAEQYAADLLP